MAATDAATDIGFVTTFGRWADAEYTPLAEVIEFTPPEVSRDSVAFTHHGSPDRHGEFKPGLADGGEASLVYNLVPGLADDAVIAAHLTTNTVETWRIVFPNGAKLEFDGFATRHGRATPLDDKMTGSVTFKVSGKPRMIGTDWWDDVEVEGGALLTIGDNVLGLPSGGILALNYDPPFLGVVYPPNS